MAIKCYEYNEANQLSKVKECGNNHTIAEYVYDYNGLRMVKKIYVTGTLSNTVVSWGDHYETRTPVGGSAANTTYYWVNRELLSKKNPDGSRYYYQNDHLGSASLLTNSGGSVTEETSYDPWGVVKSGGEKSKFQYTGQEKDSETGLNYYNARYYSSDMKRFTQPDDIIQNVYAPQTLNRYAYVTNNPIRYVDPTGHINEILKYNQALNNYYKKPSVQNYNNYLTVTHSIQNQPVGSKAQDQNNSGNFIHTSQSGTPSILTLRNNTEEAQKHRLNVFTSPSVNSVKVLWFINKVRDYGEWDYKEKCGRGCENFGNYNYGLTGKAMGFSTETLQRSAGSVQQLTNTVAPLLGNGKVHTKNSPFTGYPYGDSFENGRSIDQEMIINGAENYDSPW